MNCENVKPEYYKGGLAIIEYFDIEKNEIKWDRVRAFVVMKFPYNGKDVKQAFYRSSGHNSAASFLPIEFTDEQVRGTWIPFNGIVVIKKSIEEEEEEDKLPSSFKKSEENTSFILKNPFVDLGKGILSRFHNDPNLAMVSYLMGGGIWNTEKGKNFFSTEGFEPGCIHLTTELIPATMYEVNCYINDAISWNWHPVDIKTYRKNETSPIISLANPDFLTELDDRYFISDYLFYSPTLLNYLHPRTIGSTKVVNFEINASDSVRGLARFHKNIQWKEPKELFRKKLEESGAITGDKKRQKRFGKRRRKSRKSKRRSRKRRSRKRHSRKRQRKSKKKI